MKRRAVVAVVCCVLALPAVASAQTTTSESTTTTTESTTTTTERPPRAPTTTTPAVLADLSEPVEEPQAAADEQEDTAELPPPYDGPVLNVDLASATFDPRAASTYAAWNQARAELEALRGAQQTLEQRAADLTAAAQTARDAFVAADRTAQARWAGLRRYAVRVYMSGPSAEPDLRTRRGQLQAQFRDVLLRRYGEDRAEVDRLRAVVAEADRRAAEARQLVADPSDDAGIAEINQRIASLAAALRLYAVGDTGTPSNFRFPIAAPYRFSNSWGAPRMTGTAFAHTHKGVDVFAERYAPLVAVEPGTVVRRGSDRLGGLKLWLIGDSGYLYYYAHLDHFVPEVVDGTRVVPGQTIGFVGSSGNASGGPTHLHFEVHVAGRAVNPYPLLVVASSGDPNSRSPR